jgi:hypothetical protein
MRTANNARKMVEKTIRKIQVPAYCPVEVGVHEEEKRGVVVEVKKVIAIMFISIIVIVPDAGPSVDVGMAIPPMVFVGDPDIGIVMDMSIFILKKGRCCGSGKPDYQQQFTPF